MLDWLFCCFCCGSADTQTKFAAAKWFHFGLFAFSVILTWILRTYAEDMLDWVPELDSCKKKSDDGDVENTCFGKGTVLRLSFALFAFHCFHALFLIQCRVVEDARTVLHTDCLGLKWSIWSAFVVLSFFIPQEFFDGYGELARVLSGVFLIFQALVLIETIYKANESMIDRDECVYPLIAGALGTFILGFVLLSLGYAFYAPRVSCSTNVFWITWTLIMGIIVTLLSISPWRIDNAGLLTSGFVFAYCGFKLLSALSSEPRNACVSHGGIGTGWILVLNIIFALAAILLSTLSTGTGDVIDSEQEGEPLPYRPDLFHVVFALAAAYTAMLFTNWNLQDVGEDLSVDRGWISAWIKIITQWFVFLLYAWTLVAPNIFPDRDFS